MTLNFCTGRGMLGSSRDPVRTDPTAFQFWGRRQIMPCSHLVCGACGADVKWHETVMVHGGPGVLPAAYAAADPLTVNGVRRGLDGRRLYLCRCAYYECGSAVGLYLSETRPELGLPEAWACAGHPLVTLPTTVHGVPILADPDWMARIKEAFRQPVDPERPHFWSRWLREVYGTLAGTPHPRRIDVAIGTLLVSDEVLLRAHAINFLWSPLDAPATDLLPPMLLEDAETLRAQRGPLGPADLYDATIRAIAFHVDRGRWPYDGDLREAMRQHVSEPGRLEGIGWLVAQRDPTWFLEQLDALRERSPEAVEELAELKETAVQWQAMG